MLKIRFSNTFFVHYFNLTDLFYENDYQEQGSWSIDGGATWNDFSQSDIGITQSVYNGEFRLSIGAEVKLK
jgi:hypothetical protein